MIRYDIEPLAAIGPVALGASREQVRRAMPGEPQPIRKGGGTEVDTWHAFAFQVFYDRQGRVEFVELSRSDAFQAVLYGVDVFRSKARALLPHLDARHAYDRDDTEDESCFTFPEESGPREAWM